MWSQIFYKILFFLGKSIASIFSLCIVIIFSICLHCYAEEISPRGISVQPKDVGNSYYQTKWALVIGIDKYKSIPALQYAVNDARSIKSVLNNYGFKDKNVFELYNTDATKDEILSILHNKLSKSTKPDDCLFVFFAGHGLTLKTKNNKEVGFLVPQDGNFSNPFESCISMDILKSISEIVQAKHIFFVIDACYSGYALSRSLPIVEREQGYIKKITSIRARQVLTAGGSDEQALEFAGHGIFTEKFLLALEGAGDINYDGFITASELGFYLRKKVSIASNNMQTPIYGNISGEGDFVFYDNTTGKKRNNKNRTDYLMLDKYEHHYHKALGLLQQLEYDKARAELMLSLKYKPGDYWAIEKINFLKTRVKSEFVINDILGNEMLLIPAGNSLFGSDDGFPDEKPSRRIYVPDFYIDKTEVSNGSYKKFLEHIEHGVDQKLIHPQSPKDMDYTPASWQKNGANIIPDEPVRGVNWFAAWSYAKWLNKRLPTEAEWEKAARGIDGRDYPWGDEWLPDATNWYGARSIRRPMKVTDFMRDVSLYKVQFMAGNVREWVLEHDKNYAINNVPKDNNGVYFKPIRGGSFKTKTPQRLALSSRSFRHPNSYISTVGFRCVKDLKDH